MQRIVRPVVVRTWFWHVDGSHVVVHGTGFESIWGKRELFCAGIQGPRERAIGIEDVVYSSCDCLGLTWAYG